MMASSAASSSAGEVSYTPIEVRIEIDKTSGVIKNFDNIVNIFCNVQEPLDSVLNVTLKDLGQHWNISSEELCNVYVNLVQFTVIRGEASPCQMFLALLLVYERTFRPKAEASSGNGSTIDEGHILEFSGLGMDILPKHVKFPPYHMSERPVSKSDQTFFSKMFIKAGGRFIHVVLFVSDEVENILHHLQEVAQINEIERRLQLTHEALGKKRKPFDSTILSTVS